MARLPERFRAWDERNGLVTVGHCTMREARWALTRSLPTMDHACRLFDAVRELLGERGWVDPEGGEVRRRLLVRDREHPAWLVPHALLEHCWADGRPAQVTGALIKFKDDDPLVPADAPEGWKPGDPWWGEKVPEPEIVPRGPRMRGGDLAIREGATHWTFSYDDAGKRSGGERSGGDLFSLQRYEGVKPFVLDTLARPPTPAPISLLLRADLDPGGHAIEEFARFIVEMDPWGKVSARVCLPVPLPGGAMGAWDRAQPALREALWTGRVPDGARWLVGDGYEGTAVAWGATRGEAIERWRDEVRRVQPLPPGMREVTPLRPPAPADPTPPRPLEEIKDADGRTRGFSTGPITVTFKGSGATLPWPEPGDETTPAALVPLQPLSQEVPPAFRAIGFTRWVRLLGQLGQVSHGLLREDVRGFTFIGEGVLDLVDAATLDAEMDQCDAREQAELATLPAEFHNPWSDPEYTDRLIHYGCWDPQHQKRVPLTQAGAQFGGGVSVRSLDGDAMRWRVTRARIPG